MPRKKQYNEEEVLEKAMHLFWRNGFESTSVRDLEQELGINQFSIYASFRNKRNLFIRSIKKYRQHAFDKMYLSLTTEGATLKDLENVLRSVIQNTGEGDRMGCFIVNTTGTTIASDDEIAAELNIYYTAIRNMLKRLLRNSVFAGLINQQTNIEKESSYLLGIMQGLSVGLRILPEQQLNDFLDTAFERYYKSKSI